MHYINNNNKWYRKKSLSATLKSVRKLSQANFLWSDTTWSTNKRNLSYVNSVTRGSSFSNTLKSINTPTLEPNPLYATSMGAPSLFVREGSSQFTEKMSILSTKPAINSTGEGKTTMRRIKGTSMDQSFQVEDWCKTLVTSNKCTKCQELITLTVILWTMTPCSHHSTAIWSKTRVFRIKWRSLLIIKIKILKMTGRGNYRKELLNSGKITTRSQTHYCKITRIRNLKQTKWRGTSQVPSMTTVKMNRQLWMDRVPWTNSISNRHNFKILFNSSNNNKWTNKKYWMKSKEEMNTRTSFKTKEEWAKSQTNLNFQTLLWIASISTFQRPTRICYVRISIMKIK